MGMSAISTRSGAGGQTCLATGLSLALLLLSPGLADAGTYTVAGCDGSGRIDGWVASASSAEYATAYGGGCPGYPNAGGLIARSVARGTKTLAPAGSYASWTFRAPPGTRIVGFSGYFISNASAGWLPGIRDPYTGRWLNCSLACPIVHPQWTFLSYSGLSLPAISITTLCAAGGCRRDGSHRGQARVSHTGVVLADDWRPEIRITGGSIAAGGWLRGLRTLGYSARDNTGIRTLRTLVDGHTVGRSDRTCDPWAVTPCRSTAGKMTLDTRVLFPRDGRHVITLEGTDGGFNRGAASGTIYIDNTPPAQPKSLSVPAAGRWQSSNRFSASWSLPANEASPIWGAAYRLCPDVKAPRCVTRRHAGARLTSIKDLSVPHDGRWMLRLWLRDRAGNEDRDRSLVAGPLLLDRVAPGVKLLPRRSSDPTRLSVEASDAVSGVKDVAIEVHRRGSKVWRDLRVRRVAGHWSAVVDDEALAAGRYDIRARAIDAAQNERTVSATPDGRNATIKLPVRVRTALRVGRRVGHRRRQHFDRRVLTPFGRSTLLRGRLMSHGGNPFAGAVVRVSTRRSLSGARFKRIGRVRTGRRGRLRFRVPRGTSRTVRFRYPGTRLIQGATRKVALGVRASSTIDVKPRSTVNGGFVTFRGRLRGRPIPAGGKLVELQVYTRRQWRTFAQPRANAKTGRWRYQYRFEATRGLVTFRFRARIRHEAVYPYELGTSRRVRVRVRGL